MKKTLPPKALAKHKEQGQLSTKCHRVYKTEKSVNITLTRSEAIKVAENLLRKANLLAEEGLADEWAIQLWILGQPSLKFGLEPIKHGSRKKQ